MNDRTYGKKLYLRKLTLHDATEEYNFWMNDDKITQYLCTKSSTLESLRNFIESSNQNKNIMLMGIFDSEKNKHIGNVKIYHNNKDHEIGIIIGDINYHGKGYAGEAILTMIDYYFKIHNNVNQIVLGVEEENIPAIKCYEKIGFVRTGEKNENNGIIMIYTRK